MVFPVRLVVPTVCEDNIRSDRRCLKAVGPENTAGPSEEHEPMAWIATNPATGETIRVVEGEEEQARIAEEQGPWLP